jgi:pimeloyl-ACP methyl ester carboxylesterase
LEARDGYADLDGLRFHYRETGAPDLATLVLLHGLGPGSDARSWDPVALALGDLRRVIAVDQRGNGETASAERYSFDLMAGDVAGLLDELGIERADLLGHSMGGSVAYAFARLHPDRLNRLIVEDTPPPTPDPGRRVPTLEELGGITAADPRMVVAILSELRDAPPSWWEALDAVAAPTLVIRGGESRIPAESVRRTAGRIQGSRLVEIPGAGHNVHIDRPGEFVAAVRQFLS